ncbi:Hypothetical predicted protein [Paramuricea clavata]|uniref:Uncharacterized protein n=1 Tax=Paramuricea clavata TaxID=317549 RepID=A0A7D9DBZ7_PARCT|nr:Hypothetical predicted protein [Paramuricea clavata]
MAFSLSKNDIPALLEQIKTLESLSQPDVPSHLLRLSQYGLRSASDFDKYHTLNLAEAAAAREAHRVHDSKASFLDAAIQTLRSHVSISLDKFQAYFTALFCDKDYTKILECIAHVDKVFQTKAPASCSSVERSDSPHPARHGRVPTAKKVRLESVFPLWEPEHDFSPHDGMPPPPCWVCFDGSDPNKSKGMTVKNVHISEQFRQDVLHGEKLPDVILLLFRDPKRFTAGNLHSKIDQWQFISAHSPYQETPIVLDWI